MAWLMLSFSLGTQVKLYISRTILFIKLGEKVGFLWDTHEEADSPKAELTVGRFHNTIHFRPGGFCAILVSSSGQRDGSFS